MSINNEWGCGPGDGILYNGEKEQTVSVGNNKAKIYKSREGSDCIHGQPKPSKAVHSAKVKTEVILGQWPG